MSLFHDEIITVGGTDYTVTPSNRLLRLIEGKGRRDDPDFNLIAVMLRFSSNSGAANDAAFITAEMINGCGGKITEDEVFAHMLALGQAEYVIFRDAVCSLIMPSAPAKKSEAPKEA